MPRRRDPAESAFQLVVYLLVLCALGIGGIAHFVETLISLVWLLGALAIAAGLIFILWFIWRSQHQAETNVALSRSPDVRVALAPSVELLREIDWYQFEKVIGRLLTIEGHEVEQLGGAKADGGVDLIARRDSSKILVQCKHWQNWRVNNATIREMVGTLKINGGDRMSVYTLNSSTGPAGELASAQGIEIVTERQILSRLQSAEITRFEDLLDPIKKCCPACDRPLVLRQGKFSPFWGCSRYPSCRGKIQIR